MESLRRLNSPQSEFVCATGSEVVESRGRVLTAHAPDAKV